MNLRISYLGVLSEDIKAHFPSDERRQFRQQSAMMVVDLDFMTGNVSTLRTEQLNDYLPDRETDDCEVSLSTDLGDPSCWPESGEYRFSDEDGLSIRAIAICEKPGILTFRAWFDGSSVKGADLWDGSVVALYGFFLDILNHKVAPCRSFRIPADASASGSAAS